MKSLPLIALILFLSGCICSCGPTQLSMAEDPVEEEPPRSEYIYYCEWSWPQKIIDWQSKDVLYVCDSKHPYCNRDTAIKGDAKCCKYNSGEKTYYDCVDIPL